jgi:XTP/dITP diphosphohydrolase
MKRKFTENKLLIASNNHDKVKEITRLFSPLGIEIIPVSNFNLAEPEETESTFIGNALLKAQYYGRATSLPALADDSGISIDALDGFPGVYSARVAGEDKDFTKAFDIIEQKLQLNGLKTSLASFHCALSLWWPDEHSHTVEGVITGKISFEHKKDKGFGYDPIFTAEGYTQTFAQMGMLDKNKISHRAIAIKKLIEDCF